jgi:hypothetical protein
MFTTARHALLTALAIAAAMVMLAFPAFGLGAGKNSTRIVVSLKFPAFHGKLASGRKACLANRTVKMYRQRSGKKVLLGRDASNAKGKWAIPVGKNLTSGAYYATVAKKGKCKAAKSTVLPID